MRTPLSELDVVRAASLGDALRLMQDDGRAPMAGCTDVLVQANFGTLRERRFVDIWGLGELRAITTRDGTLVLGALASYTSLRASSEVRARLPMLVDAAGQVGGAQIQNRGTLGGNIANASPAGDSLPVLMAADAVVVLRSADTERRVPLAEFYTGYRASVKRADELIVAVEVAPVEGRQWFRKVGTRAAQAISKVVVAAVRGPSGPRIALGSVGPTVVRARRTEAALAAGAGVAEAALILGSEISPIDDVRSTGAYRRTVAMNLLGRFWGETG
jgi:CO/xanthine dehydrogenase FAD-binding subunit